MARNYRLKERGTGVTLYPETTTEQVYVPGGGNLKNLLPQMQEQINSKQPSVPGKGLSANDYTNDDKAAVGEWAEAWDIFTVHGELWQLDGTVAISGSWRRSPMMPLDRKHAMTLEAIYPRIVFFDAGGKAVGHKQIAGNVIEPLTVQPEEYPANAAFFTASYNAQIKRWEYLPKNFPTHNAAATQAIQASKVALFDDMFTQAVGANGKVDHSHVDEDGKSTPYLCNGIWLTYGEAIEIYGHGRMVNADTSTRYSAVRSRTVLPSDIKFSTALLLYTYRASSVEVVSAKLGLPANDTFLDCTKLREIRDIYAPNCNDRSRMSQTYKGCSALERITGISRTFPVSFSLEDSPLIDLDTFALIVEKKYASDSAISQTITVHPEVYAKLTDETNAEWHKVLTDALARNISFATV